jgi:quercetin dioxygenase-like cupin family protein
MALSLRRVVTGHDEGGRAVVIIDETCKAASLREGVSGTVVWSTEGFPVDNSGNADTAQRRVATSESNGTVFRVIEYAPGGGPRMHRTESIDYAVVLSGEIDMQLDDTEVHLSAGDVLVQRGTIHAWSNRGREPCVIAFILIGAEPVSIGGRVLGTTVKHPA